MNAAQDHVDALARERKLILDQGLDAREIRVYQI
jgi:hypothetical protein